MQPVSKVQNFRYNLRALMGHRRLTQVILAKMAGTGYPHLNRVLQGHSEPSLELCERLADAAGVPLEDLISPPPKFSETYLTEITV